MLDQLDCADDSGIAAIKKDIADAEASLSKLEQQEKSIPPNLKLPSVNMQISTSKVQTLILLNYMHREWRCVRRSLSPHLIVSTLLMAKSMILC